MLSPLQFEIARMEASGLPRLEIVRRSGATPETVCNLLYRIRVRLGVPARDRRALAAALLEVDVIRRGGQSRPVSARYGIRRGHPVRIVAGRYAGRSGQWAGAHSDGRVRVAINGALVHLMAQYVEIAQ